MLVGNHEEITTIVLNKVQEYSPIFRVWLGPVPLIFTVKPEYIQEILNHGLEKAWIMKQAGYQLSGDSIMSSKVSKWKRNRSIVVRGFSPVLLKSYFKVFVEKNVILIENLNKKLNDDKPFDIFDYISKTTMDAVCGSTLGYDVNAQNSNSSYYNAVQNLFFLMFERIFHPWKLADIYYKFTEDGKQSEKNRDVILGLASKIITEKRKIQYENAMQNHTLEIQDIKKNVFNKPLLDYLIDITENNQEFDNEQLRDEINIVILGGYETSANALSYVLLNLAAHKDIQEKVCEELFEVLDGDLNRPIEIDDLPKLKYMDMVLKESMRLYSTVPIIAREITKDIQMGDFLIPKGSTCVIPILSLHRDHNLWKEPLKFDPERFTPENMKGRHPYAYIPFGGGPRNCIGIRYASMFMKTLLATLLCRYEFHTDLNLNELKMQMEVSLKLVGGHQVRITSRIKN
ncbi:cytochrome P450 4C1-like [Chrysoperla carnea]|uniref:cytochrome P450 4C1-like n=1 Tax=Chrysoperla carnea TaxID=189513 RepID=UPI001D077156|nr:cytochrome P450 4C1-like [Chrysoperla carnea]